MTSISQLDCPAARLLADFPFDHVLTQTSIDSLLHNDLDTINGSCSGAVIGRDPETRLFFRAGFEEYTIKHIQNEYNILTKLKCYDFIPRLVDLRVMDGIPGHSGLGKYTIIFSEFILGVTLDKIPNTPEYEKGIKWTLRLVHRLYSEIGFVHKDLHTNNMTLTPNGNIYLTQFATSSIPTTFETRESWVGDLSIFIDSLYPYTTKEQSDALDAFELELERLQSSVDPNLYLEYITKLERAVFALNS